MASLKWAALPLVESKSATPSAQATVSYVLLDTHALASFSRILNLVDLVTSPN